MAPRRRALSEQLLGVVLCCTACLPLVARRARHGATPPRTWAAPWAPAAPAALQAGPGRYPRPNFEGFGEAVELSTEPPVWLVRDFLSREDCESLIEDGRAGIRPEKVYEGSFVVFDEDRLRPLMLLGPLCAAATYSFRGGDLLAAVLALVAFAGVVFLLKEGLRWYMTSAVASGGKGGARFSGSKWQLGPLLPGEDPLGGARGRLLERARLLCNVPSVSWLVPPTLTRYRRGDGQDAHVDSRERPRADAGRAEREAFEAQGGQRVLQCLAYLNDVDASQHGGHTCFHRDTLDGLRVRPEAGSALVFCVSFTNGEEDLRLVHSAEALRGDVEKWVVPLWSLEGPHEDWAAWAGAGAEPGVAEAASGSA